VVEVENKSADAFAHILCQPTAGIARNRQLLILLVDTNTPLRPEDEAFDRKAFQEQVPVEASGKTPAQPAARGNEENRKDAAAPNAKESARPAPAEQAAKAAPAAPAKPADKPSAVPAKPPQKPAAPAATPAPPKGAAQ